MFEDTGKNMMPFEKMKYIKKAILNKQSFCVFNIFINCVEI